MFGPVDVVMLPSVAFYGLQGGVLVCGGRLRNGYEKVREGGAIWLQKEKASLFDLCNPFGTR